MSLDRYLQSGIPLSEASAFFIRLKKFGSEAYAPPDETGELEGQFSVPVEQALALMTEILVNEFKSMLAYRVYAETMRGLSREGLEEEFEEHGADELEHAEFLLRRMSVLGGPVHIPDIPAPPPATDMEEIIQILIRMEQEGIEKWRALLAVCGENPTKHQVESYLVTEQEHLDELWQHLPHTAHQPILGPGAASAGGAPMPPVMEAPPAAAAAEPKEEKPTPKTASVIFHRKDDPKKIAHLFAPGAQTRESMWATPEGEKTAAARMKLALDSMMAAPSMDETLPPQQGTGAGTQPQGGLDPRTSAYLQNEQQGRQAEEANASSFYKQRFDEAQQQLQAATQAQEQLQQQTMALQQQAQQTSLSVASAQQTAQQATQMAMQQVTQAQDEGLRQQMGTAQMRQAYQALRGQLMDMASQEPPPTALPGTAMPGQVDPSMGGQAAPGQVGGTPDATAGAQGPAAQAAPAAGQPGDVPPGGDTAQQAPQEPSTPKEAPGAGAGSTQVTVKQGGALGAGIGAAIGGAGEAMLARGDNSGLRDKVKQLEGDQGGFAKAMELAKNKAMLALSEVDHKHPGTATLMGSLMGAGIGHATEPAIRSLADSARRLI